MVSLNQAISSQARTHPKRDFFWSQVHSLFSRSPSGSIVPRVERHESTEQRSIQLLMRCNKADPLQNASRSSFPGRVLHGLSRVLFLAAFMVAAAAVWRYPGATFLTPEGPWLEVDPARFETGSVTQGLSIPLSFELVNRNPKKPVIIFGATEMCGPFGCIDGSNVPVTVPPGGKARLQFMFRAGTDPVFEYDLFIYTNAPGQTEVPLKIVGQTAAYVGPEQY